MIAAVAVLMTACSGADTGKKENANKEDQAQEQEAPKMAMAFFGNKIDESEAKDLNEVVTAMEGKDSMDVKLAGQVDKVCQVKGCWMTMPYGEGESMRVSFRDYGFFVPKDIDGKDVVVDGTIYLETTSVEDLRHYAEDGGASEEEMAAITEPETALTFVADGVVVKDYEVKTDAAKESEQNHEESHDHDHDHAEDEEGHTHG